MNVGCQLLRSHDSKIYVCGTSGLGAMNDRDFMLLRYTPDGMLDPSLNSTGYVLTSMGPDWDEANALDMQPDGKIVLAGFRSGIFTTGDNDIAMARYLVGDQPQTVTGSLDCQLMSGVLPFISQFTVQLGNLTDENRRAAADQHCHAEFKHGILRWKDHPQSSSPPRIANIFMYSKVIFILGRSGFGYQSVRMGCAAELKTTCSKSITSRAPG